MSDHRKNGVLFLFYDTIQSAMKLADSTAYTNHLYRYVIQSKEDLTASTFERRLQKKNKSLNQGFLFDLSQIKIDHDYVNFLDQNLTASDQVLFTGAQRGFDKAFFEKMASTQASQNVLIQDRNDLIAFKLQSLKPWERLIFNPLDVPSLQELSNSELFLQTTVGDQAFWYFSNYDSSRKKSLTVQEIGSFIENNKVQTLPDLPYWNSQIPQSYELEPLVDIDWMTSTTDPRIRLSIIVPTFNNCLFLTNVIRHLLKQKSDPSTYEIIVVDDGSTDETSKALQSLVSDLNNKINFKFIYWTKAPAAKAPQAFFRAGLARNLGVHHAAGDYLFFLDSDMITPEDFVADVIQNLQTHDLIQYQRYHLKQNASLENPSYTTVNLKECYIEEKPYWSNLFFIDNWMNLENYWKYTCTYALGMKRQDFIRCGRFKRHYVSYGFEDTDIGYRMYLMNKQFKLVQKPLIHLTAYNQQQYQNSKYLRDQLLRKTSRLFFLDHLTPEVFQTFNFYYKFEKPLTALIKDLF